jgi:hypothetical protein
LKLINETLKSIQVELEKTSIYLNRNNMKVIKGKTDVTFTDYVFIYKGYQDHRKYLNVRLRNRTEELMSECLAMTEELVNEK